MRWKRSRPKPHKLAERRKVAQFLLLPRTIGGETRWLEAAIWEEQCVMTGGEVNPELHAWTYVQWINP